jgi:hypothetical protein
MELTLTPEEQELLVNILEQHHRELLNEIWHTHHREFKLTLRSDEKLLESLLARLREVPVHHQAHS